MKTHHWVGFTASLKNLYGVIPGIKYGWPKNVLHHAGIPQTVFDINASLPKTIAIVDGIVGMEGDGPIMGSAKPMGLVVIGTNPTAVDATLGRIMGFDPARSATCNWRPIGWGRSTKSCIEQRGERWQSVASPFTDHRSRRTCNCGSAPRRAGYLAGPSASRCMHCRHQRSRSSPFGPSTARAPHWPSGSCWLGFSCLD